MLADRLNARLPRAAGIVLALSAYFMFSWQDAILKWLVADYQIPQLLFIRSFTIMVLCLVIGRRQLVWRVVNSPNKAPLLMRGVLILIAWLCYYTAARKLQLAELVTIYFAAPLTITVLSVLLLDEHVRWQRWAGTSLGFVGVVIACDPVRVGASLPVLLTLIAAVVWAYSSILARQISRLETSMMQMLFSNSAFVVVCGVTLPWLWATPGWSAGALMIAVGLAGAAGQYFLFESFRLSAASLIAPFEYSSLVWAFTLSYFVWGDIPHRNVFLGAGLIAFSGLLVILGEWHADRVRQLDPGK